MRQHGVPNFPDPVVSTQGNAHTIRMVAPKSIVGSPQAAAANKACAGILPMPSPAQIAQQQHAREQHLLAFAECMRQHGITDFPDPTSQGEITREMLASAGIDLQAPALRAAGLSCVPASGGELTRAAVIAATSANGGAGGGSGASAGGSG